MAVRLRPAYARAYFELGMTRTGLHDEGGALKALQKAVALAPDEHFLQGFRVPGFSINSPGGWPTGGL